MMTTAHLHSWPGRGLTGPDRPAPPRSGTWLSVSEGRRRGRSRRPGGAGSSLSAAGPRPAGSRTARSRQSPGGVGGRWRCRPPPRSAARCGPGYPAGRAAPGHRKKRAKLS
jgi:hypothetical protein